MYQSFEDLEVYKRDTQFCDAIWDICISTSLSKDYKLREQINGSLGSVMANIDESTYKKLNHNAEELLNQLSKFINYLKHSN